MEVMTTTTSTAVIHRLEKIFTRLGLLEVLTTDNASNFCSQQFKDFCVDNGIKLMHTTPYWPAANGEVERQNQSILKALKIGRIKGETVEYSLQNYLYMYTVTPHSVTGVSPAELMFGRRFRDKFPHFHEDPVVPEEVKDRDLVAKFRTKNYRDVRVNAKERDIKIGDHVLMKAQQRENKLAPNFHPRPAVVIDKNGSSITVRAENGEIYRRNSSHLKPVGDSTNNEEVSSSEPEDAVEDPTDNCAEHTSIFGTPSAASSPLTRAVNGSSAAGSTGATRSPDVVERPKRNVKVPVKFNAYLLDFA